MIAKLLEAWLRGGPYGPIVDGVTNIDLARRIVHFELGHIKESEPDLLAVAGLLITNDVRDHLMTMRRGARKRSSLGRAWKLVINLRAFPTTAAARKVLSPPVRVVCTPTVGTSYALEAAAIPPQISAEPASRGVQRVLLDGANFCFMGACGQRRCLRRQGQAGIYVGNLKPKWVGRLRAQAGLCLGREVRSKEGVASAFSALRRGR